MKKLIALISSVAIVLSFSAGAMAAAVELVNQTAGSQTNGTQTITSTTYDSATEQFVTKVEGVTGQATLLAYVGNGITLDNSTIEYIDQVTAGTTTEFTYKLKNTPDDYLDVFTIKVGGSNVTNPVSQKLQAIPSPSISPSTSPEPTDYSITGTVLALGQLWGEGYEHLDGVWTTYATLMDEFAGDVVEGFEPIPVVSSSGEFTIENVPTGNYVVRISRGGYLSRYMRAEVSNAPLDLDDIYNVTTLYAGDINDSWDIGPADFNIFVTSFGESDYDSLAYPAASDFNASGDVGPADFNNFVTGFGKSYSDYPGADALGF